MLEASASATVAAALCAWSLAVVAALLAELAVFALGLELLGLALGLAVALAAASGLALALLADSACGAAPGSGGACGREAALSCDENPFEDAPPTGRSRFAELAAPLRPAALADWLGVVTDILAPISVLPRVVVHARRFPSGCGAPRSSDPRC